MLPNKYADFSYLSVGWRVFLFWPQPFKCCSLYERDCFLYCFYSWESMNWFKLLSNLHSRKLSGKKWGDILNICTSMTCNSLSFSCSLVSYLMRVTLLLVKLGVLIISIISCKSLRKNFTSLFHVNNEYKIWFDFRSDVNNALMMMILEKSV